MENIYPGDTKIVGEEKARGFYEISGGTLRAEEYLLMDDDGEGTLRVIGTEPVVQLQRIDMKAGFGHKLEFVLSSSGVSQIDVLVTKLSVIPIRAQMFTVKSL
jgi:hypothetical protein